MKAYSRARLCARQTPALATAGDEEEVVVMGGEGFTPEQIKEAEADFERRLGISLTGGGGLVGWWVGGDWLGMPIPILGARQAWAGG